MPLAITNSTLNAIKLQLISSCYKLLAILTFFLSKSREYGLFKIDKILIQG
jgi:hypothetical protein